MGIRTILFLDGISSRKRVRVAGGAFIVGDPTAYVLRDGQTVWVRPSELGDSLGIQFVEV